MKHKHMHPCTTMVHGIRTLTHSFSFTADTETNKQTLDSRDDIRRSRRRNIQTKKKRRSEEDE